MYLTKYTIKTYIKFKKYKNVLLIQLYTNKIDFNIFLYEIKIFNILNSNYDYLRRENMRVKHVLLKCLKWSTEKEELIYPFRTIDIKKILISKKKTKTVVNMIQRTKILSQFNKIVDQDTRQRLRELSKYQKEKEDKIEK